MSEFLEDVKVICEKHNVQVRVNMKHRVQGSALSSSLQGLIDDEEKVLQNYFVTLSLPYPATVKEDVNIHSEPSSEE